MKSRRQRACERHKPFDKEGQAFAHLLAKLRAGEVDPGTKTYHCWTCGKWHIGGAGRMSLERVLRGE